VSAKMPWSNPREVNVFNARPNLVKTKGCRVAVGLQMYELGAALISSLASPNAPYRRTKASSLSCK